MKKVKSYNIFDRIQEKLKDYIVWEDKVEKLELIGSSDVSYKEDIAQVCVCVMKFDDLKIKEKIILKRKVRFPYKAGYLMFREGPLILEAIEKLKTLPDCFIFDGNGVLHPKNLGLATFLGIILEIPTIGCAKTLFLGKYKTPSEKRGSFSYIRYKGKILGMALRTQNNVKEVFVSCGWGITLKKAKDIVLKISKFRIPEPLRIAHLYSKFYD